jgi:hypothetical protein
MIIEIQTLKSKSELQTAIQKLNPKQATLYLNVDRKKLEEIGKQLDRSRSFELLILER